MAKLEDEIQNRFFDNLINQEDKFKGTAVFVYQKLVLLRYFEVIKNSFPLFSKYLSEKELEKSVKAFMKNTPNTPFIWQIPNEYRKFVKKNKLFHDKKFLYELLYYDWIEIELYMKEYKFKKKEKFSYKNSFVISKSARIKRFSYDIIGSNYESKRENFLVIYYDFTSNDIVFRQINQLIFILIQRLNKKQSLGKILKQLCLENEIDFKEAKKVLKEPLKELFSFDVLIN